MSRPLAVIEMSSLLCYTQQPIQLPNIVTYYAISVAKVAGF